MKALKELLSELTFTCERGNLEKEITAVVYDSRKIVEGCLFVCIKGQILTDIRLPQRLQRKKRLRLSYPKK